jgi:anti-sigma factor RsiW
VSAAIAPLACQELVELVTSYLEGVLSLDERAAFDHHIGTCDGCDQYLQQMRQTIEISGRLTPADISAEAEAALLAAFRDWRVG